VGSILIIILSIQVSNFVVLGLSLSGSCFSYTVPYHAHNGDASTKNYESLSLHNPVFFLVYNQAEVKFMHR
jgi:hypothetical protein